MDKEGEFILKGGEEWHKREDILFIVGQGGKVQWLQTSKTEDPTDECRGKSFCCY